MSEVLIVCIFNSGKASAVKPRRNTFTHAINVGVECYPQKKGVWLNTSCGKHLVYHHWCLVYVGFRPGCNFFNPNLRNEEVRLHGRRPPPATDITASTPRLALCKVAVNPGSGTHAEAGAWLDPAPFRTASSIRKPYNVRYPARRMSKPEHVWIQILLAQILSGVPEVSRGFHPRALHARFFSTSCEDPVLLGINLPQKEFNSYIYKRRLESHLAFRGEIIELRQITFERDIPCRRFVFPNSPRTTRTTPAIPQTWGPVVGNDGIPAAFRLGNRLTRTPGGVRALVPGCDASDRHTESLGGGKRREACLCDTGRDPASMSTDECSTPA
ncbi:hypothetical protein BJ322DRAFT_1023399 [Thelephora terrestris]|uniref:Uncharacterized protein n=1 Tax=Thelephora terrestris TaxID=56493 RepID=A0A9P6H860_9AGAM|nr:hypothetical protein BJ322DRAFT_1023399 [Thelephora terrestris]